MTAIFARLEHVLLPGESLKFTVQREKGGLVVLLQPVLDHAPETVPDAVAQARANLSLPLRLAMPACDLDQAFDRLIGEYAAARERLHDACQGVIATLREAEKATKAKAAVAAQTRAAKRAAGAARTMEVGKSETARAAPPSASAPATRNTSSESMPQPGNLF